MRPARLRIATSLILSLVRPAICAAGSGNDFTDRQSDRDQQLSDPLCFDPFNRRLRLPAITDFGEL